jgi:hypothetical protein
LFVSPGCLAIAVSVATSYFEEPAPELTRHYAVDFETAHAACWANLTARGYPAPAVPRAPDRGVATLQVHDVTVQVSRLSADLTRVQACMGGFTNEEMLRNTELFLADLDRLLE